MDNAYIIIKDNNEENIKTNCLDIILKFIKDKKINIFGKK